METKRAPAEIVSAADLLPYAPKDFVWPRCPEGEEFLHERLEGFLEHHSFARTLRDRMLAETSTRMIDWVDHLDIPVRAPTLSALHRANFRGYHNEGRLAWWHPHADFPRVLLNSEPWHEELAIAVENLEEFQRVHNLCAVPIEGVADGRYRCLRLPEGEYELAIVERRGYQGFTPDTDGERAGKYRAARERWRNRERTSEDDVRGMQATLVLAQELAASLGPDLAADAVLAEERAYWQSRNRAAQVQKARQDALGLGWANHDHHTFRSSREHFLALMEIFRALGFKKRERYYAGDAAGWGAQILEQPGAGFVVFADVDLLPEERLDDFSVQPLLPSQKYNTVGLWCALHGESMLQGGMHHLEAQFDFDRLRQDLVERHDIMTMKPFSDFPYLRQAFTQGETWAVALRRLERLRGRVDEALLERLGREGAVGSHLENLQRSEGYKGFHKDGVDAILRAVHPEVIASEQKRTQESVTQAVAEK